MIANNINIKTVKPIKSDIYIYIDMSRLQAEEETQKAFGWAARDSSGILSPFHFTRRYVCAYEKYVFFFFHINCMIYTLSLNKEFW
jgi:hypothetical protein